MERSSPAPVADRTSESEQGKLFVGGISSDTREEALSEHFAKYGELKEVTVMRDRVTGNGRGFGFVQFVDTEAAESALKEVKHVIRGRTVEVKRAIPRGGQNQYQQYHNSHQNGGSSRSSRNCSSNDINNGSNTNSKKIFIGGLPDNVTQHELKSYFGKFGSVIDTVVMFDNMTQRPRGFGFITFSSEEPVAAVLQNRHHQLNGKLVEVKIAVPKDENSYTNNTINVIGGRGGRLPNYVPYQQNFYPRYGYYEYFNNYVTTPFSPYFYGGLYGGGYSTSGFHGIGHGGLLCGPRSPWNDSRGMLKPIICPPCADPGSGMSVTAGGFAQGHGSDGRNENQDGSDVKVAVGSTAESQVEVEDVKCDS